MKRVFITGIGVVSPIGIGRIEFWKNLIGGKCGTADLENVDTSLFKNHRGGEVKNLDPYPLVSPTEVASLQRGALMAVMAARMALDDAAIHLDKENLDRVGVALGTTMGEIQALEKANQIRFKKGPEHRYPELLAAYAPVQIAGAVSKALGIRGPSTIIPNACAAGNFALVNSFELIRQGKADYMLAGGVDPFSLNAFTGFNRLGAVSHDVVRPFDKDSKGMMVSEGAGVVVMEAAESVEKRNAVIYAELIGYGLTCDANHMTAPHPDGIRRAMMQALKMANLQPAAIDAVIAHGTGTPANDHAEIGGLKSVFGQRKNQVPVTSIKSMLGHSMGAASAIEAITNALMVQNDIIPPTIHFTSPHSEIDPNILIVGNQCMHKRVCCGMNNALAFGGNNSSLIMKKFVRG